jgi:hypothetical protein
VKIDTGGRQPEEAEFTDKPSPRTNGARRESRTSESVTRFNAGNAEGWICP